MSAVGHCGDNAACEGFFGMLKRERIHRHRCPTLDVAKAMCSTTSSDSSTLVCDEESLRGISSFHPFPNRP